MEKIDYRKTLKHLYKPSPKIVEIVSVPKMNFLMVDGQGDPNTSQAFQDAIEVLYPVSYALKFMIKRSDAGIDYGVLPLEGLWWAEDMSSFTAGNKADWKWTLMIMQPEFIDEVLVGTAIDQVKVKKNPRALSLLRFMAFEEGQAAQVMHIGPFSEEGPTVERLHAFIEESGAARRGKHHEIYLSDIRRAKPEKWKTIVRQPIT